MIIHQPGKISGRITMLGTKESCVYLLDGGNTYSIIGGGTANIIPEVEKQIIDSGIDVNRIERLLILHSHFDHMAIAPWCRKKWPWIQITSSPRAEKNLSNPKVMKTITDFSMLLLERAGISDRATEFCLPFEPLPVDDIVKNGDIIRCGDRTIEIIEVPGHSSCSIAAYIPEEKALAASDAGGIPFGDDVLTAANSNFDQYQESLEKMAAFPVEIHMAEHYGAMTGDDAGAFLPRSIESAVKTRKLIEETLSRTGDPAKTTDEVTEYLVSRASDYFLPKELIHMVVGQMTRYLAAK